MARSGMFSPLGSRTYRLVFAGQVASAVGDGMVSVALAFAVLQVTGSVAALGLVLGTRSAFTILGLLLGGTVADRFSQRPVMVVADATRCASQALLAGLLFSGSARLWELVVLSAVHGSCSAFFYPAVTALAPQLVQSSQLQQANALRWAADATGGVVGPAAAGLVVASASPAWAIAGDSLTFAVSAATLAALPLAPAGRAADASLIRQLVEGWREFASRPWLWTANIQAAATNGLLLAPFYVAGPFVSRERLGGPSAWGLILAAGGVGTWWSGRTAAAAAAAHVHGSAALRRVRRPGRPARAGNAGMDDRRFRAHRLGRRDRRQRLLGDDGAGARPRACAVAGDGVRLVLLAGRAAGGVSHGRRTGRPARCDRGSLDHAGRRLRRVLRHPLGPVAAEDRAVRR